MTESTRATLRFPGIAYDPTGKRASLRNRLARCGNDEGVDRTTFVRAYALRRRVSSIGAMPTALSLGRTRLKQICAFIGRNKILDRTSPDALFHHRATMLKRSERFNPHHVQPLAQFVDHLVFSQSPR